jgi:hypothetical protein
MSRQTVDEKLTQADVAISNAADPAIAPLLEPYSFGAEGLAEGQSRLDAARQARSHRQELRGVQQGCTRQVKEAQKTAREKYVALVKVARTIFKDRPEVLVKLGIQGGAPSSLAGLLQAGATLLDNLADPAIAAELAEYGHPPARIAELAAAFEALRQANVAQEAAKGDVQQATREFQAALSALDDWMQRFRPIARDALRDHPDYLEKLGILARS